ncbi:hypothetical protein SAMN05192561_101879 [Halopenitus malekzadehii]|uniref:Uncharacterized protein n=1 Tax=Halopenitus malekzadehii TaxID=1267564 RepID=A0A1H6I621_9EURY|nr:hypothetical protein [Halopenitus malekzadehii]SEH42259.1 hypothetical protein SAMN05192561_101879 [Halopenitus malekzadehii]
MTDPTRRNALLGIGTIAAGIGVTGCLDAPADGTGNGTDEPPRTDPGETPGGETPTDQPDPPSDGPVERVSANAVAIGLPAESAAPRWARGSTSGSGQPVGYVTRFDSPAGAQWVLEDLPEGPERSAAVRAFVENTDFGEATLLYVGSVGPNTCYARLEVQDVRTEAEAIAGTATAADTSRGDVGCGEAITYPAALVRVTGDDLPAGTAFTVTNGWGDAATLDATAPLIDPATLSGRVRPATDPPAEPDALDCPADDFERHPAWFDEADVTYGSIGAGDADETHGDASGPDPAVALRARGPEGSDDSLRFERGETVAIDLVNVAGRTLSTGNRHKYALEVRTTDGWTDVRGARGDPARFEYTDEAIGHPPGEGFEWSFDLTEEGLLEGHPLADRLTVCPDLQPGRYRFVYWGVPTDPIAVAFDLRG